MTSDMKSDILNIYLLVSCDRQRCSVPVKGLSLLTLGSLTYFALCLGCLQQSESLMTFLGGS